MAVGSVSCRTPPLLATRGKAIQLTSASEFLYLSGYTHPLCLGKETLRIPDVPGGTWQRCMHHRWSITHRNHTERLAGGDDHEIA